MEKRLYRNPRNKMIGGVCTGLGEYFSIDPVLVRLVFVILAFEHGLGILAYIILWIVVPVRAVAFSAPADASAEATAETLDEAPAEEPPAAKGKGAMVGGVTLIVIGVLFLLDNLFPGFGFEEFWPLVLIAIGSGLLWNSWPRHNGLDGGMAS